MANRRLSTAEDIELLNNDFKNERWESAAQEILEMWDAGIRTYVDMGEHGEFSRSHYSNVMDEHFQVIYDDVSLPSHGDDIDIAELPVDRETFMQLYRLIYRDAYNEGFSDGANWARQSE